MAQKDGQIREAKTSGSISRPHHGAAEFRPELSTVEMNFLPSNAKLRYLTLHTTHGDLKVEIFCESIPRTAENFLALCASGAYDGTPFHRLIPDFMIQGGDTSLSPLNTPENPIVKGGESIYGQYFEDEIKVPALRHSARGMVSMANKGPETNGSQFFITLKEAAHLDGKNTVFGRVISGAEEGGVLERMESVEVDKKYRPKREKIVITTVTIHANPIAG